MDAKLIEAGPDGELLFYRAIQYAVANRTDGRISGKVLEILSRGLTKTRRQKAWHLLEELGLVVEIGEGLFMVAKFAEWQKPSTYWDDLHDVRAEAGRKGGLARAAKMRGDDPEPPSEGKQTPKQVLDPGSKQTPSNGLTGSTEAVLAKSKQSREEQIREEQPADAHAAPPNTGAQIIPIDHDPQPRKTAKRLAHLFATLAPQPGASVLTFTTMIERQIRRRADLDETTHEAILRTATTDPWWKREGKNLPSLPDRVYGSDTRYERCIADWEATTHSSSEYDPTTAAKTIADYEAKHGPI